MKSFYKAAAVALSIMLFMQLSSPKRESIAQVKPEQPKKTEKAKDKLAVKPRANGRVVKVEQGSIYLYQLHETIGKKTVSMILSRSNGKDGYAVYNLNRRGDGRSGSHLFASALNVQNIHQIVNSYLVGYIPFKTDNIWTPLLTLSQRKAYQYDHIQYHGRRDVWQTSRESFNSPRGDCEDHAIALADWLIEMGEDARVITGKLKSGGHAWVVLFKDGKEFLLEATWKSKGRNTLKHYPLASMFTHYQPEYMFNRNDFWFNQGSSRTTNYSSKNWIKKSRYN